MIGIAAAAVAMHIGGLSAGGAAAAAAPRAGRACARAGATNSRPPLLCAAVTLGGRTVLRWVSPPAGGATTIAGAPATTAAPAPGGATAAGCPEGRWKATPVQMQAFLAEATGGAATLDAVVLTGELQIAFTGGTMTGSGRINGTSPDGLVSVTVTPAATATYTVAGGVLTYTNLRSLLDMQISVAGAPVPMPGFDSTTPTLSMPVQCASGELVLTVAIPAAAGQPARSARYHLLRA